MDVELLHVLLPHLDAVVVDEVAVDRGVIHVRAHTRPETACRCPDCGTPSARAHSRYERHLADTAIGGRRVVIDLSARRLFCDNAACPRHSFAEQVDGLTIRYSRRTPGLVRVVQAVALALAGRAGARLLLVMGVVVSRTTMISVIMRLPDPALTLAPRVLGVDDFALRKGERYGTILIDCESGRPVDLLPDREADTLAAWLIAHPGAEVICRDRAGAYADGARTGAPDALQVADRWHLWNGLGEYVEKEVARHHACLPEPVPDDTSEQEKELTARAEAGAAALYESSHPHIGRVRERYAAVHGLLATGRSMKAIARQLGLAYNTVRKYARAKDAEEILATGWQDRPTILDPYKPYLHQRLGKEKVSDVALFREIRALGYPGNSGTVSAYLRGLRTIGAVPADTPVPTPKVREISRWIMTPPENLGEEDHTRLKAVLARCPELAATTSHVHDFADMLTQLRGDQLKGWLNRVYVSDLPSLHAFANGIDRDRAAVTAGLSLPYSSGKVEGNVNRVKMLMRQMFGRARFALLRKRVLLA
jgi:transposase